MAEFKVGDVVAHIKADITDFKSGVEKSKGLIGDFKNGIGDLAGAVGKAGLVLGGMAVAGGVAIKMFADTAGEAEKEVIKSMALLENAAKKMPTTSFAALKKEIENTSQAFIQLGFDDEETMLAMTKSIAVTHDLTESKKELALAADFARLQDIGIGEAQKLLQLAYMGNARVLKQYGIELSDNASKAEIFGKIQELAGGQAEKFASSYSGQVARFNVEFGNMKEAIGANFLPLMTKLFEKLNELVSFLQTADFSFFTDFINMQVIPAFTNLQWAVQAFVDNFIIYFNTYLMPFIQLVVQFFAEHWDEIRLTLEVTFDLIKEIVILALGVLTVTFKFFFEWLSAFWKQYGDEIMTVTKGVFEVIKGIIQVVLGVIYAVVGFTLKAIRGDWDGAWLAVVKGTELALTGIKSLLNGAWNFVKGWGSLLYDALVKPFVDAWNRISDLINKIKDGLDFTKRHSPSVVDIVNTGVRKVNEALSKLDAGITVAPHAAAAVMPSASGVDTIHNLAVNIDMGNALIADETSAMRVSELIGNRILDKLKMSVRV